MKFTIHAAKYPALCCALFLGGLCPSLSASDDDLLRILEQKGFLSAAEVQEIRAARAAEREQEAGQTGLFVIMPSGKNVVELKLSGRLQFQYNGIAASVDNSSGRQSLPGTSQASFRRIFLGIDFTLPNDWYVSAAFNFADSAATNGGLVDHAVIGWNGSPELNAKVGYEKVPFSYNTTTSSAKLMTIEFSPASQFFSNSLAFSSYHAAGWLFGELDSGLAYSVAVGNGGQGFSGSGSNGYSLWGRAQYTTQLDRIGTTLMVGADLGYQSDNGSAVTWLNGASIFGYSVYAQAQAGDLLLIGEFLGSRVEGVGGYNDSNPYGATGTVAYTVDKFQPVFQYAYVDSANFAGGINPGQLVYGAPTDIGTMGTIAGPHRMHSFYLGGNYYIMGNDLRLSVGAIYVTAPANNGSDGNGTSYEALGGRAQLQVLF